MKNKDKKAHDAGWNDAINGITTADQATVTAYVTRLAQIVQVAIDEGKATFYHYGIQDALDQHWLGRVLSQVA